MGKLADRCGPACEGTVLKLASILPTGLTQRSENALGPNLAVRLRAVPLAFTHKKLVTGEPARELPRIMSLKLIGGEA
jgi:hypothetical protein